VDDRFIKGLSISFGDILCVKVVTFEKQRVAFDVGIESVSKSCVIEDVTYNKTDQSNPCVRPMLYTSLSLLLDIMGNIFMGFLSMKQSF
jgi:hypothetical protein